MKKLLTTLIGLAAFNVLADVIIYDDHLTYTTTGNGSTSHKSDSGWSVLDVQSGAITTLLLFKSQGYFEVVSPPTEIHHVTTTLGKDIMVVYVYNPGGSGLGTASGVSTSLNTGTTSYTAPKTLTASSSYINGTWPLSYWQTVKGSLTFDSARTLTQNQIDGNYTNTVQRLTQVLLSEGYTQAH